MKKTLILSILLFAGISGYTQTYKPVTSTNKYYLQTVKGITYTYKNGVIEVKNNSKYAIGTLSITVSSKIDSTLFGIVLFEDDVLEKGATARQTVYFTRGIGKDEKEIPLKEIDPKDLVFSFDKATRAIKK